MKKPRPKTSPRKDRKIRVAKKVVRTNKDKPTNRGVFSFKRRHREAWRVKYFQLVKRHNICPISTVSQYREALTNMNSLIKPRPDRAESYAIDLLARYIVDYESLSHPTPDVPPGRMLAHMIEARELTQAEVAESTGIPASTISAVIAGRRKLSTNAIGRLCEYFDVSSDVFIQRQSVTTSQR